MSQDYRQLVAALAQFVQEHMPWPYEDVDRHSDEANDTAWAIAEKVAPVMEREWTDSRLTEPTR